MEKACDNSSDFERLIASFERKRKPIQVNFRKLVSSIPYNSERATHFLHPYPAKLLLHIPHFFLSNNLLSSEGDLVLDPFCGSGTVLLESILCKRKACGLDANPLARAISRVKTTPIDPDQLVEATEQLLASLGELEVDESEPDVVNLNHWFYPHVTKQLLTIRSGIAKVADRRIRDFFLICFSACVRRSSLADPRVTVPVRLNKSRYPEGHWLHIQATNKLNRLRRMNVVTEFGMIVEANNARMRKFATVAGKTKASVVGNDSRDATQFEKLIARSPNAKAQPLVQLIITSPPYAGAQKYIRSSSLSLGWLNLCSTSNLRAECGNSVGREHYYKDEYAELTTTGISHADWHLKRIHNRYPLRAHIAANYLLEMQQCFTNSIRTLKRGGYFVLVAANNSICGKNFATKDYLKAILEAQGLKLKLELLDDIHSRGLMTKRNKTASVITRESVLLFQK
jgi:DNA modification methylase